jgi:galactokinase
MSFGLLNLSPASIVDLLTAQFHEMFGTDMRIFRAPGRVNLIGEHTDYNDGFVMPAAIGFYTWVAAARRADLTINAYSDRFDEKISLSLDALASPPRRHWSDYIRGSPPFCSKRDTNLTEPILRFTERFRSAPDLVLRPRWRSRPPWL